MLSFMWGGEYKIIVAANRKEYLNNLKGRPTLREKKIQANITVR